MMAGRYQLKLLFEWRGGTLWCDSDASLDRFGVGPVEGRVQLSAATRRELERLSAWHDKALDWDDPRAPSPWSKEERNRFEDAAARVLETLRDELGPDFEVRYDPL